MDKPSSNASRRTSFKTVIRILFYVLVVASMLFIARYSSSGSVPQEVGWRDVAAYMISAGAVDKIEVVNEERAFIYIKNSFADSSYFREAMHDKNGKPLTTGPQYVMNIGAMESFEKRLDDAQQGLPAASRIDVRYTTSASWAWELLSWILPFFLLIVFWRFMMLRGGSDRSLFSFGKSRATLITNENAPKYTFADVAGLDEAEQEVREIVDFLKNPDRFTRLGAKIPKGVILVGPPGTGKTLLAKAVAGEANVPFFSMSGSEFVEMFVGVGASRVRDLFKLAKEKTPSIVFIDEIDAIGRSRSKNAVFTGSNDERESTLNQLLKEMDGFESNSGVIVLAATNRADMLDAALLRPGRFDRHIYLELPGKKDRHQIFEVHVKNIKLGKDVDLAVLAAQTPGFSGADIANVCNEAALIAARNDSEFVDNGYFIQAIDRVVAGLEKKSKVITPAEKKRIAYHEAGHALVSWKLPNVDPLAKVSIIPRGKSLGASWYLPEEKQMRTSAEFREHLCATLGGRVAEEQVFGDVTSGALDDLEKVTKEAYMMVAYFGFDKKVGAISFYDSTGLRDSEFTKPYSEDTARIIDEQVRNLVRDCYAQTAHIIERFRKQLDDLADALLQKEIIYKEDIERILGQRSGRELAPAFEVKQTIS